MHGPMERERKLVVLLGCDEMVVVVPAWPGRGSAGVDGAFELAGHRDLPVRAAPS
jgi:hypothetical protein